MTDSSQADIKTSIISKNVFSSTFAFNETDRSWETLKSMNEAREFHTCTELQVRKYWKILENIQNILFSCRVKSTVWVAWPPVELY